MISRAVAKKRFRGLKVLLTLRRKGELSHKKISSRRAAPLCRNWSRETRKLSRCKARFMTWMMRSLRWRVSTRHTLGWLEDMEVLVQTNLSQFTNLNSSMVLKVPLKIQEWEVVSHANDLLSWVALVWDLSEAQWQR